MTLSEELKTFISEAKTSGMTSSFDVACEDSKAILKKSGLPYLPILGFEVPAQEMLEEAKALQSLMLAHRSDYEDNRGWKSLVLHGISSLHTQGAEKYGMDPEDNSIYRWTDISDMAPVTTAFFKEQFHYDWFHRVRIMMLEPGGYICPHTDFDHYTLGPVNIALNNPEGCEFVMQNAGVVPFQQGTIKKLALVNRHAVFNNSDQARFHIIVHGCPNWEYWSPVYMNSYRRFVDHESTSSHLEESK